MPKDEILAGAAIIEIRKGIKLKELMIYQLKRLKPSARRQ